MEYYIKYDQKGTKRGYRRVINMYPSQRTAVFKFGRSGLSKKKQVDKLEVL